jgi:FkbM family methyltransferase
MSNDISQSSAAALFSCLPGFAEEFRLNPKNPLFKFVNFCAANIAESHSQLLQDLFVLYALKSKKGGFFVEFGATNGITLSNSYMLERHYRWKGILAEPARCWRDALRANRKAIIDNRCVWTESGRTLSFSEANVAELSTISEFVDKDFNRDGRAGSASYEVETVSLNELLAHHQAPKVIDYMSIDTEGSEFPILQRFDFSKYDIKVMTVEHNYCEPDRENIRLLLSLAGFVRVFEPISRWDDWYVKADIANGW